MRIITLLLAGALFSVTSCSKNNDTTNTINPPASVAPSVTTNSPTSISFYTASCGGTIISNGSSTIVKSGVAWNTDRNLVKNLGSSQYVYGSASSGSYNNSITGLTRNTKYYVCAFATSTAGTGFGDIDSFTTTRGILLGDTLNGGYAIYVDSSNLHGLMAASADQSTGIRWNNGTVMYITGAQDTAWGSGLANTNAIIAAQGAGSYAASICRNYTGGGYHDWYLPSLSELNYMLGGLPLANYPNYEDYWSSSEGGTSVAWVVYNNTLVSHFKDTYPTYTSFRVRAIRSF